MPSDVDFVQGADVDSCVKYWYQINKKPTGIFKYQILTEFDFRLSKGVPNSKLIMGMATYGSTFALQDPTINGLFAPSTGPGTAGIWTEQEGSLSYYEVT